MPDAEKEALCARIDELCAEVERLRQENQSIGMAAYELGRAGLADENERLRGLVRDMRTCIDHACMCEFCPLFASEDIGEPRCIADVKARMRELGIEVDE